MKLPANFIKSRGSTEWYNTPELYQFCGYNDKVNLHRPRLRERWKDMP